MKGEEKMITPLDIENKKFSKRALNGYSTEEVDDFLDELTIAYEKLYKESAENKQMIDNLNNELNKYRQMESTLQNTLLMAQSAAEEIKNEAKKQADTMVSEAEAAANSEIQRIETEVAKKQKELEDIQLQFANFKQQMESLLISELELIKN